ALPKTRFSAKTAPINLTKQTHRVLTGCAIRATPMLAALYWLLTTSHLYWNNFGPKSRKYARQLIHVCPPPVVLNSWLMLFFVRIMSRFLAEFSRKSLSPTLMEKSL